MLFNEKPRALALVGMPGAGKTMCAKYLESRGFYQFRFGGIVTDEVERRGLPITPENERLVREEFRHNEGMDAIAKRALPQLKRAWDQRNTIIIDGLYGFSEYKLLHDEFGGDMIVVAVVCSRRLRYERLTTRAERPLTIEEAVQRDIQEIEKLEKGGPIAMADFTLVNNDTPEMLLGHLDQILTEFSMEP